MTQIESAFKTINPIYPFEYTFLDDSYNKLYGEEQTIGTLAFSFTIIAVLISVLGLLGLAAYATERKKKEVSIRKILGATLSNLLLQLSS